MAQTVLLPDALHHPVAAARAEAAADPAQLARAGADKADDPHPLRMPVVPARVATIRPELLPKSNDENGNAQETSENKPTDDTKRTSRRRPPRRRKEDDAPADRTKQKKPE